MPIDEPDSEDDGFLEEYNPLTTMMGTGLMVTQGPAAAKALGAGPVYHGTTSDNLQSIMDEGLKLDYAGQKKRLNSQMMENALVEMVADRDENFSYDEDVAEMEERFSNVDPDANSDVGKNYAKNLISETQDIIRERTGEAPSTEEVNKFLKGRGRRLYFGHSPHTVTDWGSNLTEAEMMGRMAGGGAGDEMTKQLRPMLDMMSGGAYGVVTDEVAPAVQYQRSRMDAPAKEVSPENFQMEIDRMRGQMPDKSLEPVLKVHPTGQNMRSFGVFNDFPGLSGMMSASYSMKDVIKDMGLPNWSPGRDLSFADDVSPRQIEEAQMIDPETGKVERVLRNESFQRPSRLRRIAGGAPRALAPLALAGVGAGLALKGVTGRGPVERATEGVKDEEGRYDMDRVRSKFEGLMPKTSSSHQETDELEKRGASGLQAEAIRRAAKYSAPAVASAVPAVAGSKYMMDKVEEKGVPKGVAAAGTNFTTGLGHTGAGIGTMAYDGSAAAKGATSPATVADHAIASQSGNVTSAMGQEYGMMPKSEMAFGENKFTKDIAPYVEGAGMAGALVGVPTYAASRYYPIQVKKLTDSDMVSGLLDSSDATNMSRAARFALPGLAIGAVGAAGGYAVDQMDDETFDKAKEWIPDGQLDVFSSKDQKNDSSSEDGAERHQKDPDMKDSSGNDPELNGAVEKEGGGPGSGKSRDSTAPIERLDKSPLVTIHRRKKIMNHRSPEQTGKDLSLGQIEYGAQSNYDVEKLGWMLSHVEEWEEDPVQVVRIEGDHHLMDGHHRVLAADRLGMDSVKADVYVMDEDEVRRVTGQKEGSAKTYLADEAIGMGAGAGLGYGTDTFDYLSDSKGGQVAMGATLGAGAGASFGPQVRKLIGKTEPSGPTLREVAPPGVGKEASLSKGKEKTAFDSYSESVSAEDPTKARMISTWSRRSPDFVKDRAEYMDEQASATPTYEYGFGEPHKYTPPNQTASSVSEMKGGVDEAPRRNIRSGNMTGYVPLTAHEDADRLVAEHKNEQITEPVREALPLVGLAGGLALGGAGGARAARKIDMSPAEGMAAGGFAGGIGGLLGGAKGESSMDTIQYYSPEDVSAEEFVEEKTGSQTDKTESQLGFSKTAISEEVAERLRQAAMSESGGKADTAMEWAPDMGEYDNALGLESTKRVRDRFYTPSVEESARLRGNPSRAEDAFRSRSLRNVSESLQDVLNEKGQGATRGASGADRLQERSFALDNLRNQIPSLSEDATPEETARKARNLYQKADEKRLDLALEGEKNKKYHGLFDEGYSSPERVQFKQEGIRQIEGPFSQMSDSIAEQFETNPSKNIEGLTTPPSSYKPHDVNVGMIGDSIGETKGLARIDEVANKLRKVSSVSRSKEASNASPPIIAQRKYYSHLNDKMVTVEGVGDNTVELSTDDASWTERPDAVREKIREGDWEKTDQKPVDVDKEASSERRSLVSGMPADAAVKIRPDGTYVQRQIGGGVKASRPASLELDASAKELAQKRTENRRRRRRKEQVKSLNGALGALSGGAVSGAGAAGLASKLDLKPGAASPLILGGAALGGYGAYQGARHLSDELTEDPEPTQSLNDKVKNQALEEVPPGNGPQTKAASIAKVAVPLAAIGGGLAGGAAGTGLNYAKQKGEVRSGRQDRIDPYRLARSGAIGGAVGAAGPAAIRGGRELAGRAQDLGQQARRTMDEADQAFRDMQGAAEDLGNVRRNVDEGASRAEDFMNRMEGVADEISETNQSFDELAQKARDNRFFGFFSKESSAASAQRKEASKKKVADAFVQFANKTDAPSPSKFESFLQDVDGVPNPTVRARPEKLNGPDMNGDNVVFAGNGDGPEMWEVATDEGRQLVPGIKSGGDELEVPDKMPGVADTTEANAVSEVSPVDLSRAESTGGTDTEFRVPLSDEARASQMSDAIIGAGLTGAAGYGGYEYLTRSGGQQTAQKRKYADQNGTITTAEDEPSLFEEGFDFDMPDPEMPEEMEMGSPDVQSTPDMQDIDPEAMDHDQGDTDVDMTE